MDIEKIKKEILDKFLICKIGEQVILNEDFEIYISKIGYIAESDKNKNYITFKKKFEDFNFIKERYRKENNYEIFDNEVHYIMYMNLENYIDYKLDGFLNPFRGDDYI